jgi:CRISPR-associated endonuclease/helicase Cas3
MNCEPLAKSNPQITLRKHTEEVLEAVEGLISTIRDPLLALVPNSFVEMMRVAAIFHDLGKAAQGFQKSIQGITNGLPSQWGYRHEALSAAMLLATGLTDKYGLYLFAAILTHHKTLDDENLTRCTGLTIPQQPFQSSHLRVWKEKLEELQYWWEWVRSYVKDVLPELPKPLPDDPKKLPDLYTSCQALEQSLRSVHGINESTLPWIICRGLLMGGDHLASAGLCGPLTHLSGNKLRKPEGFQSRVKSVQGSVLLEAPTGSGKTEAALHWALANRLGGERIFYILPHQASINKMADRLSNLFGEEYVGILHHNAVLQEFHQHFDPDLDNYAQASIQARKRVDDTRKFYRPIKVMTPYQLLKLLFGCHYFEIGLTELLGGLVIFDEIHAYDPHIAALIEIAVQRLRTLKVRFLFMTATFPKFLKERLQEILGECTCVQLEHDHKRDVRILDSARHMLCLRNCTLEEMVSDIIRDSASKNVLVVCNRVAQAQKVYSLLKDQVASIALLHSRFIHRDRATKENQLMAYPDDPNPSRQQIPGVSVLIATQVVEVSLNVSFDTIYTEIAPVDALLQRFGRVNRLNQNNKPVPVYVATCYVRDRVQYVYEPERIDKTLQNAPNGQALYPSIENQWVQATYADGYTEKEQRKYDNACKAFESVVDNLKPYYRGDDRDFYDLFDNYSVVPKRFAHLYHRAISEKRFYDAVGYVVPLSTPTFKQMEQWTELDKANHVYIMDRRYDTELGLLNEPETNSSYLEEAIEEQCL